MAQTDLRDGFAALSRALLRPGTRAESRQILADRPVERTGCTTEALNEDSRAENEFSLPVLPGFTIGLDMPRRNPGKRIVAGMQS